MCILSTPEGNFPVFFRVAVQLVDLDPEITGDVGVALALLGKERRNAHVQASKEFNTRCFSNAERHTKRPCFNHQVLEHDAGSCIFPTATGTLQGC